MTLAADIMTSCAPPRDVPIYEWAHSAVVLTPRHATSFPGPYRVDIFPPLRGIFDALKDRETHTVVVCKGAQTGVTLLGHVWLAWATVQEPGPILAAMPSENLAGSVSENRWKPLFEDSPALSAERSSDPDDWAKLEQRLRRCTVNWVGSNSPANLASRAIRYLLIDEPDKYPQDNGREANAIALLLQRTKTFWNRKILMPSTPTTEDGTIWRFYRRGDQRKCYLPCRACGSMQFLKWERVTFDSTKPVDEAEVGAAYRCEACGAAWSDADKLDALNKHEWRSTAQSKQDGLVSFHLPSLYAPWVKWRDLVTAFLNAKDHPDLLHDFINSELGEPWTPETTKVGENIVAQRAAPYSRGQRMSEQGVFGEQYRGAETMIAIAVDVQKDHLWFVSREWVRGGDSGLIDYGKIYSWETLRDMADSLGAAWVMVDCGYDVRFQETLEACMKYRFVPCRGARTRTPGMTWTQNAVNVFEGTRRQAENASMQLVTHDSAALKLQLHERVSGASPFAWRVFSPVGDDYCRQIVSEEYDGTAWRLRRGYRDNHLLDCEVLQLLAATIAGFNSRIFGQP